MLLRSVLFGLAAVGTAAAQPPDVATDIVPIQSLAQMVMGDLGTAQAILPPGASPHDHALRPSEARALNAAQIVFRVSPDLAPGLTRPLEALASKAQVVTLMDVPGTLRRDYRDTVLFDLRSDGKDHTDAHSHGTQDKEHAHDKEHADGHFDEHSEGQGHDHSAQNDGHKHDDHDAHAEGHDPSDALTHQHAGEHDHDHAGSSDPHSWLHPDNAILWLDHMATILGDADPDNAETYRSNAAAAKVDIQGARAEIDTILADSVGPFVVFHDAYQYFELAFGVPIIGAITANDATPPSPRRLAELRDVVADNGVQCLFSEPQFDAGLVATLSDRGGLAVAVLDPLGGAIAPGAGHYPALLRDLARQIAECGG